MSKDGHFSLETKNTRMKRAAYICSRPDCRLPCIRPVEYDETAISIVGQVAHIRGRARTAARYDPNMSDDDRSHLDNSIFLCNVHARDIDNAHGTDYSVELLRSWRDEHEEWVRTEFDKLDLSQTSAEANTSVYVQGVYFNQVNINQVTGGADEVSTVKHDARVNDRRLPVLRTEVVEYLGRKLEGGRVIRGANEISKLICNIEDIYARPESAFLIEQNKNADNRFAAAFSACVEFLLGEYSAHPFTDDCLVRVGAQLSSYGTSQDDIVHKLVRELYDAWGDLVRSLKNTLGQHANFTP